MDYATYAYFLVRRYEVPPNTHRMKWFERMENNESIDLMNLEKNVSYFSGHP